MKKYCKKILALILVSMMFLSIGTSYAHSGKTDAYGGHKDNKNKSGLGSYDYNCGGNPAHLNNNGVCPYSSNTTTTVNTETVVSKESERKPKEINQTSSDKNEEIQLTTNTISKNTNDKSVEAEHSIAKVNTEENVIDLKEETVEIEDKTVSDKEDAIKEKFEDFEEVNDVQEDVNSSVDNNSDNSNSEKMK